MMQNDYVFDLSGDISSIVLGWFCGNRGIVKSLFVAVHSSSNRGGVVWDGSSSLLYPNPDTDWYEAVYGRSACDFTLMKNNIT